MSRWGELIPHDEAAAEEGSCLCGCQDDIVTAEDDAPPVDDYRLSSRPSVVSGPS